MNTTRLRIVVADPQGLDALELLSEAAIEAQALYPELHDPNGPWPTNSSTPLRGTYLVVYEGRFPIAMGALRPIDESTAEVRRMYVLKSHRRLGVARRILNELEHHAARIGFKTLRLETGNRQFPAMRLYESYGFARIAPFGTYVDTPTSVCYEKSFNAPLRTEA